MVIPLNSSAGVYRALADLVVVIHMAFVLFAALGGFLVFKWRRAAWFHIPAATWAALIEFAGWQCPLTPLENWLRRLSGEAGYQTSFIERYLIPLIYPASFTHSLHIVLGFLVLSVNLAIYWAVWRSRARNRE
ncbi:MAG TPA: DUF2784 domain-containing protein [Blastocatellia bacterium]|nr:DUF2784 domain-containing protein [Blastocatellia bacterium]